MAIEVMNGSRSRTLRVAGLLLFILGAIVGLAIGISGFMAHMEAEYYGFDELSQGRFSTLRCPTILMRDETGVVRVTLTNPLNRAIEPIVRADISSPFIPQSSRTQPSLKPGEQKTLEWTVDKSNIDLGNFIFVKVFIYSVYPLPLREATCGILVLNLPYVSGNQLLWLGIIASVVGLAGGLLLWMRGNQPLTGRRRDRAYALITLAILIGAAIVFGVIGWWVLGWIVLVVCALLLAAMLALLL